MVEALGLDEVHFDGSSDSGGVNFIAPESDEPNKEPLIRTSVGRRGLDPRTLGLKVRSSRRRTPTKTHFILLKGILASVRQTLSDVNILYCAP